MARLGPISRSDFIKRLRKEWSFEGPFQPPERTGSDHPEFLQRGDVSVTLPNKHKRKEIGIVLLQQLLGQAGITRKEWLGETDH